MNKIAVAFGVVLLIIAVFAIIRASSKTVGCRSNADCTPGAVCDSGKCVPLPPTPPAPVKPRAANVADCGWQDHLHGWFDVQGQGVANDYCRYVGGTATEKPWFSCRLAGSSNEYTGKGVVDPTQKIRASCDPRGDVPCLNQPDFKTGGGCGLPLWA